MEWPNDKVLLLIHEIESLPILWDSSDPYYKISRKKNETWEKNRKLEYFGHMLRGPKYELLQAIKCGTKSRGKEG